MRRNSPMMVVIGKTREEGAARWTMSQDLPTVFRDGWTVST
jgi:hypothetical protein